MSAIVQLIYETALLYQADLFRCHYRPRYPRSRHMVCDIHIQIG
jgi:hypothetical protein